MTHSPYSENASPDYYQKLHDENAAFQNNNWMLDELNELREIGGTSILEVGCGNGRFLEAASSIWDTVVGVDWARSPRIGEVLEAHSNVSFEKMDVVKETISGSFDVVASADFLEHLSPDDLASTMSKLLGLGRVNFHKIACYDDGHSHLSILAPAVWLKLWRSVPGGESIEIIKTTLRKGKADKAVIVMSNHKLLG